MVGVVAGVASVAVGLLAGAPAEAPAGPDRTLRGAAQWQTEQDADYLLRVSSGNWAAPRCVGDGVSGPRVQPVFVHRKGHRNRFATFQKVMQRSTYLTTGIFERSSGGYLTVRWVHDRQCQPKFLQVAVPSTQTYYLSTIRSYLKKKYPRFRNQDRVYALWVDARTSDSWSGLGDRKWAATWSSSFGFVWADAHELVHALGAVDNRAPHSTGKGHCYDGLDLMCYSDGGPRWRKVVACPEPESRYRLDCGRDDYFAMSPRARSWLGRHPRANVANSRFLYFGAPRVLPERPLPPSDVQRDSDSVDWQPVPQVRYDVGHVTWSGVVKWLGQDVVSGTVPAMGLKADARVFVRAVNDAGYSKRVYATYLP